MDRDEWAIIDAAKRQGVNVHRNADGNYVVGLSTATDESTAANPRRVDEAMLSGGLMRLASGRELKATLTPDEARRECGLLAREG